MKNHLYIVLVFCLSSCSISYNVEHSFEAIPKHITPDYSNNSNWSALPFIDDYADIVPDTLLKNRQDDSKIDVFFLHPTTFLDEHTPEWNVLRYN